MSTRSVVLTPHNEAVIESLVRSGRYQNASEVLREGLRLIEARESREAAKLMALRAAAAAGFADLEQDRYRDLSERDLEDCIAGLSMRAASTDKAGE